MKKVLLVLSCCGLLWTGCKEKDPLISYGSTSAKDSTWVYAASAIPAAQAHNVLVEEFTGQSCSNCPAAHSLLDGLESAPGNLNRINVISLYATSTIAGPQANSPSGAKYNFTSDDASSVLTTIFNSIPGMPSGGVDRTVYNNNLVMVSSAWSAAIDIQKVLTDSVNLTVSSSYDATTKTATITAVVVYLDSVTVPQKLSLVIVEDSIFDYQEEGVTINTNYQFNDVFRAMVTSVPKGDALPAAKGAGRAYQRVYHYTPAPHNPTDPIPSPGHLRVIAFVSDDNGSDSRVVQSQQTHLMGP